MFSSLKEQSITCTENFASLSCTVKSLLRMCSGCVRGCFVLLVFCLEVCVGAHEGRCLRLVVFVFC